LPAPPHPADSAPRTSLWKPVLAAALYSILFFSLHVIASSFRTPSGVSPWYPPPALSLLLVLWFGRRTIPLIFVTALATELITGSLSNNFPSSITLALIFSLGYGSAGWVLRDLARIDPAMRRLRDVLWLVSVAIVITPFVVALAAIGSSVLFGVVESADFADSVVTFWIGDAIGIATLAPFILGLRGFFHRHGVQGGVRRLRRNIRFEYVAQVVSIAVVLWLSVSFHQRQAITSFYFCVLPLLWMAMSHGFYRASLGVFLTNLGLIALLTLPRNNDVLVVDLQLFMLMMSLTGLLIGAIVTERERAEAELQHSESYFRSLIENASDMITILDASGIVQYESPSTQRILGYPAGLVGQRVFDYIHPEDVANVLAVFQRKLAGQRIGDSLVYRFRHAAGTWRMIESRSNLLATPAGKRVIINSHDVTERKRVEEALTAVAQGAASLSGNDFYQTMVFHLWRALRIKFVCIGLITADGHSIDVMAACDEGELIENMRYELRGTPCSEVIARQQIMHFDNAAALFPDDDFLIKHRVQSYIGVPLCDANQQVIGILNMLDVEPLRDTELRISLISIFAQRVMAELERAAAEERRLQLERTILEGQKLESLGLLAGGIAHDFNNFLTTIIGNVGLAMLEIPGDSELLPYLHTIETATRRAADLSRQMLAYSGKGRFIVSAMNVNELVKEMATLLHVSIGKQVRLQFNFDPDVPLVEMDATQIRQVVMNLIVNASDALGDQPGAITIRTGVIGADSQYMAGAHLSPDLPPGRYAFIEVADTGVGMDAATMARIFDPFFTTKFTGRGLGLAAVQGIVRTHRGMLKVQSEPGQGSTFRVLLPGVDAPAQEPAAALPPPSVYGSGMILIIDDEPAIRQTVTHMLRRLGFQTLQAAESAGGLAALHKHGDAIVLVLLDMTMPGMNGEQTLAAIREQGIATPVVLISGYYQNESVSQLIASGAAGFLHKPFTLDELQATLAAHIPLNAHDE
jgi:PAS domain S-box-containing protein